MAARIQDIRQAVAGTKAGACTLPSQHSGLATLEVCSFHMPAQIVQLSPPVLPCHASCHASHRANRGSCVQDMVAALAAMSLQNYSQVRTMAQATLATVLKRHPGLAPGVLPLYLGVISGLEGREPRAAWEDSEAALQLVVDATVPAMGQGSGQKQDISPAGAAPPCLA